MAELLDAYALPALVFLFLSGLVLYVWYLLTERRRQVEERLAPEAQEAPDEARLLLGGTLTPALATQIPMAADDRSALQQELRLAGYYRPTSFLNFAALRWFLTILPIVAGGALALFAANTQQSLYCWIGGVVVGLLGYSLPRIYIYYQGRSRAYAIDRGLPVAIDMLVLCLSAGLNLLNSMIRVARELAPSHPVLATELSIVCRQAELRSLDFAVTQFADRVNTPNVRNFAVILSQTEMLGTDALATLREYSDSMRVGQRQRAEEMANRAPFKLLFPAYLMAIGAAILIISPTVLEFQEFRRVNAIGNTNNEARQQLQTSAQGEPTTTPTTTRADP